MSESLFIKKEEEILDALKKTNYAFFDGDKDKGLDAIEAALLTFAEYRYVCTVQKTKKASDEIAYENRPRVSKKKAKEGEKEIAETYPDVIDSLNFLNNLCESLGLTPFAVVDTEDKRQVERFIQEFCSDVFTVGMARSDNED